MNTGIFTIDQAKIEHHSSARLAFQLTTILPKNVPVIDYGCGKGTYIKYLSERGYNCTGFEGTPDIREVADFNGIIQADLTKPLGERPSGSVICLEAAEHIGAEFESVLLDNITQNCTGKLVISWAVKGQGGCGHVNEQNSHYVIPAIEARGFAYNRMQSQRLRTYAGADLWWFRKSIYVFDRKG